MFFFGLACRALFFVACSLLPEARAGAFFDKVSFGAVRPTLSFTFDVARSVLWPPASPVSETLHSYTEFGTTVPLPSRLLSKDLFGRCLFDKEVAVVSFRFLLRDTGLDFGLATCDVDVFF